MALQEEIDRMRKEIRTDEYSMSIGEWISMYKEGELDIHPEFQRIFRWRETQKTRFIESILLGIPIPSIFVSQRDDGKWEVVDGVQRLSTIFEFAGILRDEDGNLNPPLVLKSIPKYLPSLENKVWQESFINNSTEISALDSTQRLQVKRSKIGVSIILKESDQNTKYELFQRLNTGGSHLSDQEVRNCILVMINKKMFQWIKGLAEDENFKKCVVLTERAIDEQYNLDLVLRFLVICKLNQDKEIKIGVDLDEFLTKEMVNMAQANSFDDYQVEEKAFKDTFEVLARITGEDSFRRYDRTKKKFVGPFIIPAYETIAVGIGVNHKNLPPDSKIEEIIKNLWEHEDFKKYAMGGGKSAPYRIPKIVPLGRNLFKHE